METLTYIVERPHAGLSRHRGLLILVGRLVALVGESKGGVCPFNGAWVNLTGWVYVWG